MRIIAILVIFLNFLGITVAMSPLCAGPTYQPTYQPTYNSNEQRRLVEIVSSRVLQINPAYFSAYSPDGYDSATQADILVALRSLQARLDAQDKAAIAALLIKAATGPTGATGPPGTSAPGTIPPVIPPPPPAPATGVPSSARPASGGGAAGLVALNLKCSACHQAGKLAPDQRFALLDARGNLSPMTAAQKLHVLIKVYRREMPPPGNLLGIGEVTDTENASIVDLLASN